MAKKKKTGSRVYWVCLFIYGIILTVLAGMGLKLVWSYAEEYEAAQPNNVLDAYVTQLSENLWDEGIAETVSAMPHEVQSDEEVAEHVKELLKNGITYIRMGSDGNGDVVNYSLRCNGNEFGVVKIAEDESYADKVKFNMLPWKIMSEEFDFSGLYSSVEAVIPRTYSLWLNGIRLGSEYIVEENIPYDVLKDYYDEFENLPSKVKYKFDNVIGTLEPVIKDEAGEVFVIDETKDDSQYIKSCSEEELAELSEFTAGFVVNYLKYTSGVLDPMYGYGLLKPYLMENADLDSRMQAAMDGLSWAHTVSITVNSSVLNSAIALGDGFYMCDITSNATTFAYGSGEVVNESNMRVIVKRTDDGIKAISLELY